MGYWFWGIPLVLATMQVYYHNYKENNLQILFVSDIHLNLKSEKLWETERFLKLFSDLGETIKSDGLDLVVLGGDIFDRARPSIEEIKLFYQAIELLELPPDKIIVIAGNHEEVRKPMYTFDYLPQDGFTYYKEHKITEKGTDIYFVSHSNLNSLAGIVDNLSNRKNLLFTHVRCTIPPHITEEYPLLKVNNSFDLVISGDIHFRWDAYDKIMYPGTPYSHSYKTEVDHGYFIIDTDTLEVEHRLTYYPNKIKISLPYRKIKEVHKLPKENFYKVQVSGSVEDLEKLPQLDNIIYEKLVTTQEVEEQEEHLVTLDDITDKDVVKNLMVFTQKTYQLSPEVMSEGERILGGMFS